MPQIPELVDPFCVPPATTNSWRKTRITLFQRINQPKRIPMAYRCAIKQTNEVYYTNLLGDRFVSATRQTIPMSKDDCTKMMLLKECRPTEQSLILQNDGSWSTENAIVEDFPGIFASLFVGEKTATVTNCLLQPIELFYRPQNYELISPMHHTEKCSYVEEFCGMADNSSLVWIKHCQLGHCKNCEFGPHHHHPVE